MLTSIKRGMRIPILWLEGIFDFIFGQRFNPIYHLGALTWFFYWIVCFSGIYIYILFDTGVNNAHPSVEWLTNDHWWHAGIMRSMHRYASDAMVIFMAVHMLREFLLDRYHGVRWFAWFTGVPLIWMLITSGITGYWLVWDELAQYMAIASFEWLDWLGIFSEPIANNFLKEGSLGDRFFTLLIFMHIFVPIGLLFLMWIHLLRLNHAETTPPRPIALGAFLIIFLLSLAFPVSSHAPADLGKVPTAVGLDWFYMAGYPLLDLLGPGILWVLAVGASGFIAALPWIIPRKPHAVAVVDLPNCNGCGRCFEDCPFGAVNMQKRTDPDSRYDLEAVVKESFCTGCAICTGSCPASTPYRKSEELVTGIDVADIALTALRRKMHSEAERLTGETKVLVFGCDFSWDAQSYESDEVGVIGAICIGQIPPSFIEYALNRCGADGVFLRGCRKGDCFHRLGVYWTEERLTGYRDPYLRPRIAREQVRVSWAAPTDKNNTAGQLEEFKRDLVEFKAAKAAREAEDAAAKAKSADAAPAAGE